MCTTAAKWLDNSWFLIKTRDPVSWMRWDDEIRLFATKDDRYTKMMIHNPDFRQDGYYGGINDCGVAMVATFVRVSDNQVSYIRRPYMRLILDAATAREAVEIIKTFNPRIGGNILVADKTECFGIEAAPDEYYIEKVDKRKGMVKTNHFLHLPNRNLSFDALPDLEQWSKNHQERAEELVARARLVEDLQAILKDRENSESKTAICTIPDEEACYTHSAMVFDTNNKRVWYAQGNPLTTPFIEYNFDTKKPKLIGEEKQSD